VRLLRKRLSGSTLIHLYIAGIVTASLFLLVAQELSK
jgi:hypothetical protein